ncbi:hypothetical protein [Sphingomonas sp. Leaf339]|uniref:hypothetical protein n=1 Tax=Sphingomonas sp. Leaf339 TaxID=1736343 RepID=UPI000A8C30CE|nr:hypothetical protein [Sphingomonas sp. Leaf339]
MIYTTYEDRRAAMVGVELLARSLRRHNPKSRLIVWSPLERQAVTGLGEADVDWRVAPELAGSGWNVKPTVLLRSLKEDDRVMWMDSDIIVVDSLERAAVFPLDHLVVSQEFRSSGAVGSQVRVDAWRWQLKRSMPVHVNSGAIVASRVHEPLLRAWEQLLKSDDYRAAQQIFPVTARPTHLLGDQDVLWALLCATFASVQVSYLKNGVDIIQDSGANGYHLFNRLGSLRGERAMLVHALGRVKPWQFRERSLQKTAGIGYSAWVGHELSAYFIAAEPYTDALANPVWLRRRNPLARAIEVVTPQSLGGPGIPLSFIAWLAASTLGRFRKR